MKARLLLALVAFVILGAVGYRLSQVKAAETAPATRAKVATLVRVVPVVRADVEERVSFTGTVRAAQEVQIFAKLPGRVTNIYVREGGRVRPGQTLASVEHVEVSWQARAAAAQAEAAEAGVAAARVGVEGAVLEFETTSRLAAGGSAPQTVLDGSAVKLKGARAQVRLAEAQVKMAKAQAGLVQQQVSNAKMTSPIYGTIVARNVDIGAMAGQQLPAFTVADLRTLKLEASVDPATFARLSRKLPAAIESDSLPGETFKGAVDLLTPHLDPRTRRASIEISIDNASGRLLPNAFASAHVVIDKLEGALVVPAAAILDAAGGPTLFRVDGDRIDVVRPRLGPTQGDVVVVLEGLEEGDEVALTDLSNLRDGQTVKKVAATTRSN